MSKNKVAVPIDINASRDDITDVVSTMVTIANAQFDLYETMIRSQSGVREGWKQEWKTRKQLQEALIPKSVPVLRIS